MGHPFRDDSQCKYAALNAEYAFVEKELRMRLWLGHGHQGMYGDDGEMQCSECLKFGNYDYRRTPIRELLETVRAVQAGVLK